MSIQLVRIDDRLIHGQVVTGWVNEYGIEQIIIVNDKLVNDSVQKSVLMMTAPANVKVHVFGVSQFNTIVKKNPIKKKTMLLFSNPIDVQDVHQNGLSLESVNVGGIRYNEERNNRLSKAVSVTDQEKAALDAMIADGVDVFIQMVPKDKKETLS
ncbi:PTS system mannose/fructose/N-acetylgalactosamine-transporter subunit IIB [Enterococcus sp. AZ072]|uniref:PTS system mannose/fructose/N-acetylgalactosamine-transporter subunit IIB n=1 Tax=unclassified Enterococcus TaxID=2608891 RepID=UPI003D2B65E7